MGLETPQHECAVMGVYAPGRSVSNDLYYGLLAMQNRGQQSSGIAVIDSERQFRMHKGLGLVNAVFDQQEIDHLDGEIGVGHNRYGTTGSDSIENAQPYLIDSNLGRFAFVHNGNVYNAPELRSELEKKGIEFRSTSDSEVIAQLIATSPGRNFVEKIKSAGPRLEGAYSYVLASQEGLIGGRDPHGVWPLSMARFNGNGYVFASETNAFQRLNGHSIEDVDHGEIVVINEKGVIRDSLEKKSPTLCSFEYFYFSDPYSKILGRRVEGARFDMGVQLAKEHPFDADWTVPIPETARPAAEGYAFASGVPLRSALIRNRWQGRTFIEPSQRLREVAASMKYGPLSEIIEGSRIILVDDSIVRGTTTRRIIDLVRKAGAAEIYVLITAPPIIDVCHYGIDTADKSELIAANMTTEEIRDYIGADRLGFLSLEGGVGAIGKNLEDKLCTSCFTGNYQMKVPQFRDKLVLEAVAAR